MDSGAGKPHNSSLPKTLRENEHFELPGSRARHRWADMQTSQWNETVTSLGEAPEQHADSSQMSYSMEMHQLYQRWSNYNPGGGGHSQPTELS